ncbi:MAG: aldehyde dehydrogenase family protein, partial [Actinobacteria bacterium]|nr:aldehyde dehydrogenase family protein [Actinomycetota bacterium]
MAIESVDPTTGEVLRRFEPFTGEQIEAALREAETAYRQWRARSIAERAVPMRALAALLRERRDHYAELATKEMGKPITQARAELEKCASGCDFYADHAERFLAPQRVETSAQESYVAFEPLGIVLAVMPWNFPYWQVVRFAAPALMAGNAAILKHASNVPQCAL